eukprot:COSAG01_NODE_7364_length_3236_cov_3.667517_3_plen_302_part_00
MVDKPAKRARGGDGGAGRRQPLAGCVVVISGVVNPERSELRDMAVRLGAQYRGSWGAWSTHLIAPFDGTERGGTMTPKAAAALESGGTVVKPSWLRACHHDGRRVPELGHLLRQPAAAAPAAAVDVAAGVQPSADDAGEATEDGEGEGDTTESDSDATVDMDATVDATVADEKSADGTAAGGGARACVMPRRPTCRPRNPLTDGVDFMLLDSTSAGADISLYGVTDEGESVMLAVKGFRPYFYIRVPVGCEAGDEDDFGRALEHEMRAAKKTTGAAGGSAAGGGSPRWIEVRRIEGHCGRG